MVLKLYGYPRSTYTRLVAMICKEKEIPYQLVVVDLSKREQKNAEYMKHQPFGKVPYIEDEGFILYESRAICRYLIKKYPNQGTPGLIPTDPKEEALFEQASSIEVSYFDRFLVPFAFEKLFKKALVGGETDEAVALENLKNLVARLDVYEIILGKQRYMAGDTVTLADLQHLPYGQTLFVAGMGNEITDRPNVARWWHDLTNRPSWLAVKDGA